MAELRRRAEASFGTDFAEQQICGANRLCVDYYFPDEATIVEVALSLRNPTSEFERDVLKAVMAPSVVYASARKVATIPSHRGFLGRRTAWCFVHRAFEEHHDATW